VRYLNDEVVARLRAPVESLEEAIPSTEAPAARFELGPMVGRGGMGEVFRALDHTTGRAVAVKLIHPQAADAYLRLKREADSLARLQSPCTVRYIAHGHSGNRPFVAMEWLDGEALEDRLEREGLSVIETMAVARRIAEALAEAHEHGIVHRDVKPANVILVDRDAMQATLIDFGIAHTADAEVSLTRTGFIIGTPGYMAPEQARGSGWIDPRADVFAFGCLLYKCLTGRRPFLAEDAIAALAKTLLHEPPSPRQLVPRVPRDLDAWVMRLLRKNPGDRPADGAELRAALAGLDPTDDGRAAPTSAAYPQLGREELRLSSLLLIGVAPRSRELETLIARSAVEHGVQLVPLRDGSAAGRVSEPRSARDAASRLARVALAIRPRLQLAPMVIVTELGLTSSKDSSPDLFDHAAAELRALLPNPDASTRIRIDSVTRQLLGDGFFVGDGWLGVERAHSDVVPRQATPVLLLDTLLERLSPSARRVLRAASIFGARVPKQGVEALVHDVDVDGAIEELARADIVRVQANAELVFRDPALGEAAYAMLTPVDRSLGHQLAGDWLDKVAPTEPALAAEHYRRSARPWRAFPLFSRALTAARAAKDWVRVASLAGAASECARESESPITSRELGPLHLAASDAERWLGWPAAALASADAALHCFQRGSEEWFSSAGALCLAAGLLGLNDRVRSIVEDLPTRPKPELRGAHVMVLCQAACGWLDGGSLTDAERIFGEIEDATTDETPPAVHLAWRLRIRGKIALHRGLFARARDLHGQALELFESAGSVEEACAERVSVASAMLALGMLDAARTQLESAITSAESLGLDALLGTARALREQVVHGQG
jgi:hypothetical protein